MNRNQKDKPVILLFIADSAPTDANYSMLETLERETGAIVKFRNGRAGENDSVEICNAVAGFVFPDKEGNEVDPIPARYLAKYPRVDENGKSELPIDVLRKADPGALVSSSVAAEVGSANDPNPNPNPANNGFGGFGGFQTNT